MGLYIMVESSDALDGVSMQDWLNRTGLVLQFLALFLVTPEILGQEKVDLLAQKLWIQPLNRLAAWSDASKGTLGWTIFGIIFIWNVVWNFIFNYKVYFEGERDYGKMMGVVFRGDGIPVAITIALAVTVVLVMKGVRKFAASKRTYLPLGAVLFTVGFGALMWATWINPEAASS